LTPNTYQEIREPSNRGRIWLDKVSELRSK